MTQCPTCGQPMRGHVTVRQREDAHGAYTEFVCAFCFAVISRSGTVEIDDRPEPDSDDVAPGEHPTRAYQEGQSPMTHATIGETVNYVGPRTAAVCEHGIVGPCDECRAAALEPVNPVGILSTYVDRAAELIAEQAIAGHRALERSYGYRPAAPTIDRAAELIAADGIDNDNPVACVNPTYCADCGILISWQSPEQAAEFPGDGGADYCCEHYTERETIVSARTGRPVTLAEIRRAYDDTPPAAPDEPTEHYHVVSFINGYLNDYDSGPYDTLEDARAELARAAADVPDDMHDFIPAGVDRYEQRNGPYILKIESCTEADCGADDN